MWRTLKTALQKTQPLWQLTRLESWAALGVPDVMINADGKLLLLELKVCHATKVKLSPHQISFAQSHKSAPVWIVVNAGFSDREYIAVYAASQALDLAEQGVALPPKLLLYKPFDWIQFTNLINT